MRRDASNGRRDRERHGEIRTGLINSDATGDVHEHVSLGERDPGMARENGNDHRESAGIDARCDTARHREVGRRDERLDLEQEGPCSLEGARDRGADLAWSGPAEHRRWIGNSLQSSAGHLEHAEFISRPEAVLRRAKYAVCVVAVALELQHAIDEMFQNAGTGDGSLLCHVTDEKQRDAELLGQPEQASGRFANLGYRSGSGTDFRRVERLDGVDDADVGAFAFKHRADTFELGIRKNLNTSGTAEPVGTKLDLRRRLLAGNQQRSPTSCDVRQRSEEERRFADPRLAAHQHERGRHNAAAKDAVELPDAGRDARCVFDANVGQTQEGAGLGARGRRSTALFRERPEAAAPRAASEPAPSGVATFGACVLDGRLCHEPSLDFAVDDDRAESVPKRDQVHGQSSGRVTRPAWTGFIRTYVSVAAYCVSPSIDFEAKRPPKR